MKLPRLYAVSDEEVVPGGEIVARTEVLLEAGVKMFQVRFKRTPEEEMLRWGRELRALTARYGALLIADDSPELAREIGADGVHLGRSDPPVERAREILGAGAVVGATGYADPARVDRFDARTVDYLGLSSPHPSPTKEKARPGEEEFRRLVAAARVPVYAIGGVTPQRTPALIEAGCHGVAAVSALYGARDPREAVREFLAALPPDPPPFHCRDPLDPRE